jgi:tetratricopeptide (TPR) repeat protein
VRCAGLGLLVGLAITACATDPAERNNAGNALAARGAYDQAVDAYQLAQVLAPDRPEAYYNAGIALAEAEQLDAALAALDQALATADDALIGDARYNLGNVYFRLRRYPDAIAAYQDVLLRDPDDAEARYNMELALRFDLPPTPTAQQQQTEPDEGETDPNTTPTNQPRAEDGPTPTPPRVDDTPNESATPERGTGDFGSDAESTLMPQTEGELTMEEAQRILDSLVQDQQSLSEFLQESIPAGDTGDNDW